MKLAKVLLGFCFFLYLQGKQADTNPLSVKKIVEKVGSLRFSSYLCTQRNNI